MQGFPAVAAFLSRDPDHELYVFRRFNYLTVRNLVHLQSELMDLESRLKEVDEKMGRSDLRSEASRRNWEVFQSTAHDPSRHEHELQKLLTNLGKKLDEYHSALLQASEIAHLRRPNQRVLSAFKQEFSNMGIKGHSSRLLEDDQDLAALRPPADKDILSSFVRDHWPFPTEHLADSYYPQARHFQDRNVQIVVSTLSLVISAVLLIGSIITLYLVTNHDARLCLLIAFIILFAIGIRISTSASRDSIFAASAAYAAVLVVFVSGNLGNQCG